MGQSRFQSLRIRLLLPLVAVAGLAAIAIAAVSYALGSTWAMQQVQGRFEAIEQTLSGAPFPISQPVLESIATLTQTELLAYSDNGRTQAATIETVSLPTATSQPTTSQLSSERRLLRNAGGQGSFDRPAFTAVAIDERRYWGAAFNCRPPAPSPDAVTSIVVLFAQSDIDAARWRAAMLPLVTGLSTVVLLSTLTLALTGGLIKRLMHLERRVEQVAHGDFGIVVDDASNDEIGRLGTAINQMTSQLGQLWQAVHRQERGKLLHQLAAGLAHQLRNSLTGARMAVELHAQRCAARDDEGLQVAMLQLDQVEETVKRLLAVGTDKADAAQPSSVLQCLQNIQLSLSPFARH